VFSPDGSRLFTAGRDAAAAGLLRDVATGRTVARFGPGICFLDFTSTGRDARDRPLLYSPFSPDGTRLVAPCSDAGARVWDAATGRAMLKLQGHRRGLHVARYSPDGRLIVTGSDDETARVWDAATGQELCTLVGHEGAVYHAAFSPDGRRVATASADGTARIWLLDLVPVAERRKPRDLTAGERRRFEVEPAERRPVPVGAEGVSR
jgi:WD40 repeat protein